MTRPPHEIVGDVVLAAETKQGRVEVATDIMCYALGAIAAIAGKERAAEIAYRCADAMVKRA